MAPEPPGRRLERLANQARDRSLELAADLERRRGQPAGPGDLFVLQATADLPVEWAILESGTGGKLLAVPADAGPPAGTADFEIPADAPGGPLSLRCRFGVWLDGSIFEPRLRTGVLAAETIAEARHCFRQGESGNSGGSPLREEVDADPEYVDWIRDVPQRARDLALAARPTNVQRFPFRSWGAAHLLAAAFALVSVGLSIWVALLLQRVERLSVPPLAILSGEVVIGSTVRGGAVLQVPREAPRVALTLVLDFDSAIQPQDAYLEIVDNSGQSVWLSRSPVRLTSGEQFSLTLPRELLPYGEYHVYVHPNRENRKPLLFDEPLRVEPPE
jgi:hypothetical protein